MKLAATFGVAAALLWIAAPALSTAPDVPSARDFEQALPQPERLAPKQLRAAAAGHTIGVRFKTDPVTAPETFDLVGVAGYKHPVELRVRKSGEPWSEWITIGGGDPLYTGGADEVQVRSRKSLRDARLHYVSIEMPGEGGPIEAIRSKIKSAVVTVLGADAEAASPRPRFVSRGQWGANQKKGGCKPRGKPAYGKVKAAVVHHTVSSNNYSEAEAPGIVLGICRFHRNGNGWNDIGYNALVDRFGNIYAGRKGGMARPVIGAQAEGHNAQTAGVSAIANHESVRPTQKEQRAIINYLSWRLDKAGIKAKGKATLRSAGGSTTKTPKGKRIRVKRILGHQDTNHTACPGHYLYKRLGKIRRRTQARMDKFADAAPDSPDGGGVIPRKKK